LSLLLVLTGLMQAGSSM